MLAASVRNRNSPEVLLRGTSEFDNRGMSRDLHLADSKSAWTVSEKEKKHTSSIPILLYELKTRGKLSKEWQNKPLSISIQEYNYHQRDSISESEAYQLL